MKKEKIQKLLQGHSDRMYKAGADLVRGTVRVDDYEDKAHAIFTDDIGEINRLVAGDLITLEEAVEWKVKLLNRHTIDLRSAYHAYFSAIARGKEFKTSPGVN